MRGKITRTYRHIGRYQQILSVLVRYGFAEILQRLEIDRYLDFGARIFGTPAPTETLSLAARLRQALEELGPTFIKLGQLLSTRPDLVPLEVLRELETLQDQAREFPGEEAREIIERELGAPVEELFAAFEAEPFATASLGQVHGAVLHDGRRVVVKVQRPGVRRLVETDMEILGHLAGLAERHLEELETQRPQEVLQELARVFEKELNYTFEAAHLRRFARMFEGNPEVRVPEVHRDLSTTRVLTMERFDGFKASDLKALRDAGHDLEILAERGASAILDQIFLHGIFHADPHPGNILVLADGAIGFIDLGQVGRIGRTLRYRIAELLAALGRVDEEAAVDALLALTDSEVPAQRTVLEADLGELLDWHLDRSVGQIQLGRMLYQTVEILNRHQRRIPPELFLVLKALGTVESLARSLAPSFTLASCVEPVLRELAAERLHPAEWWRVSKAVGSEWADLVRQVPGGAADILQLLRRGKLHVQFEHKGLEPLLLKIEQVFNRMVFAVVLGSLLMASSLVVQSDLRPLWHGFPMLGLAGYLLAGIVGLWLLFSILRRGRL